MSQGEKSEDRKFASEKKVLVSTLETIAQQNKAAMKLIYGVFFF